MWVSLGVAVPVTLLLVVLAVVAGPGASGASSSSLVGGPAPALSGTELPGGAPTSLASYAGRWVLVDFAASWCAACRAELPQLEAFALSAPRHDAVVLTVEEDPTDNANLVRWLAANHARWPVVADPAASPAWGVSGIPSLFLVSPVGIVVGYYPSVPAPASLDAVIARGGG